MFHVLLAPKRRFLVVRVLNLSGDLCICRERRARNLPGAVKADAGVAEAKGRSAEAVGAPWRAGIAAGGESVGWWQRGAGAPPSSAVTIDG